MTQKGFAKKQPAGPAPPPGFKSYENNEKSGGVMHMITMIIKDAETLEAEAIRGEADAQKSYEEFVKNTNDSIDAANVDITNKTEEKGKAEAARAETDVALQAIQQTLDELKSENWNLHSECDFVMKNFEMRQSARDDEITSLEESVSILSGADFGV